MLGGASNWRTHAFPEVGFPAIKMSDGPTGVRGDQLGAEGPPGVVAPAGIALGASWDPELLSEIGGLLGNESHRKGNHVLLGPTVNLHRTPLGGRTFECFSEDPELTAALAIAWVRGVQSHRIAVTVKHFVANDTEIDRHTIDAEVDERTLRELYLRPFERIVTDAEPWGIMASYNRVNGTYAGQSRTLLTEILREEWGFDGFVVSDWFGLHDAAAGATAGLTIEMPGPARHYGSALAAAVAAGGVDPDQIDRLAGEVVDLVNRTNACERPADAAETGLDDPEERALTRRAAIAGTVLLRNAPSLADGRPVLPLEAGALRSVAVIGPNAAIDRSMGGGSASLRPFFERSLLEALHDRLPDVDLRYEIGASIDRLTPIVRGGDLRTETGQAGLAIEYFNGTDWNTEPTVLESRTHESIVRFFGSAPPGVKPRSFGMRISGQFIPSADGVHAFGVVTTGPVEVEVTPNGAAPVAIVSDPAGDLPRSREFFGFGSIEVTTEVECRAGEPVDISIRWRTEDGRGFAAFRLGVRAPAVGDLVAAAESAAAAADVAVVMVGTNDEWETEGIDRESMDLPGDQDELIRRVAAANRRTVVIVNAGSPVAMDWAEGTPAILCPFFGGQEQAEALVDILLGVADPGGRLPVTIPERLEDTPAYLTHWPDYDSAGNPVQRYGEGLFIGYRWYDARRIPPRFPFGHGLSYGSVEWGEPEVRPATEAGAFDVSITATAGPDRSATVVLQGYVAPLSARAIRPPKELKTWTKTILAAGATELFSLRFGPDDFRHWDPARSGWIIEPGDFALVLATSATDEVGRVIVRHLG